MTEQQKKDIQERHNVILQYLEYLNKEGKIGSYGYGTRSYEQGQWDPKKKKKFSDYVQAVFKLNKLTSQGSHPFKFGFTHLCLVNNPQNTYQVEILKKEYRSQTPFFHYTDILNYDDFCRELDHLANIIQNLDLRGFPENNQKMKLVN